MIRKGQIVGCGDYNKHIYGNIESMKDMGYSNVDCEKAKEVMDRIKKSRIYTLNKELESSSDSMKIKKG